MSGALRVVGISVPFLRLSRLRRRSRPDSPAELERTRPPDSVDAARRRLEERQRRERALELELDSYGMAGQ